LADLADSLSAVRARISAACAAHDRDPAHVRLLAVTKTFPAADAALLTDLGLTEFGENREQEASAKAVEVAGLRPDVTVRWHMVGHLQRNKARSVARWAAEIQSVDSPRLADALAKATRAARDAGERDAPLDALVQVSIDGDPARGGCPIADVPALIDGVTRSGELRFRGLMTVAPLGMEPDQAFGEFHQVAQRIRVEHPNAVELSCGMSNDLESAIAHGSTCVRVGTALLGGREVASP
jgi:pyridoxal phosphate enzyme (YggS family)